MYCIGCGEPLRVASGKCPSCRTEVAGALLSETVALEYGTRVVVPPVCCCCLAPRSEERIEEISTVTFFRLDQRTTKVPIPWCGSCRKRRGGYGWLSLVTVLTAAVPFYFLFAIWLGKAAILIALLAGVALAALASPLLARIFPTLSLPGHVPGCDAVSGGAGETEANLVFHNRAFAGIWRDLNSGMESNAPALKWAETRPIASDKAAPRSTGAPHSHIETRARVRDQLQTGRPPLRSKMSFGARPAGVDAAAEVLGFLLKAIEIRPDALEATDRAGTKRSVAFRELTRIVARKLPEGPPFSGAIFLDLIPRANGDRNPPIRLLPATRVNYGALPGSGATSHENFRRLVKHLKSKNPEIEVEPASVPYLEEGKGFPPALESTDALAEYESRFRVSSHAR